jgi:glycosyltransferase involved in cell wall biosynthesis
MKGRVLSRHRGGKDLRFSSDGWPEVADPGAAAQGLGRAQSPNEMRPTVVHVLDGLGAGGNETLCLQIVRHAPSHVANVVIYQDPARTEMAPLFQDLPDLRLHCVPTRGCPRLVGAWMLAKEIRRLRPVAVLIYAFGLHHVLAAFSASVAGVSSVHAAAGSRAPDSPAGRQKWRAVLWLTAVLGVPVQACSLAVERSLRELKAGLPRGSGTIPNGCDVADIARRAARARRLRGRDDPLVVGMVARLDYAKDQATLIRALAEVAKEHPQAELWLVGDGLRAGELCDLAGAEGVADRVVFWGPRSDVPELLGQMDVFAFSTTRDEGFGIALIEAMAAGLPVIASDVPACREVLGDGAAGALVPPGDHAGLAHAICALLSSEQQRAAWAGRALTRATDHYDAGVCARTWYDMLLNGRVAHA